MIPDPKTTVLESPNVTIIEENKDKDLKDEVEKKHEMVLELKN